ncbi:hypothetical protein [Dongia rigui]|uniref:Uncharacterized protein n=1 Tax=Dongia rigui TaxID=940149 RepID=A0ABU5E0N8_9PROT|nr:hypothetical protein [Dongia rigui]MDY0873115.1 hypothetical protein [Dongia rigui]
MTKRRRILILDQVALSEALKAPDELTRSLAQLISDDREHRVVSLVAALQAKIWKLRVVETKPAGRPSKWGGPGKLLAWRAVEVQWQLDKRKDPTITIKGSIDNKFKSLPRRSGRGWKISGGQDPDGTLYLTSPATARRYHAEGAAYLSTAPAEVRDRWQWDVDLYVDYFTERRFFRRRKV